MKPKCGLEWTDDAYNFTKSFLSNEVNKIEVEPICLKNTSTYLAKVIKNGQHDLGKFLVATNHCDGVEEPQLIPIPDMPAGLHPYNVSSFSKPDLDIGMCIVTHVVDPYEVYIMNTLLDLPIYESIMNDIQGTGSGLSGPATIGQLCLVALDDGKLFRAKITKLNRERTKAKVVLIDTGRTVKENVSNLIQFEAGEGYLIGNPGLARKVGFHSLVPATGDSWSQNSVQTVKEILAPDKCFLYNVEAGNVALKMLAPPFTDVGTHLVECGLALHSGIETTKSSSSTGIPENPKSDEALREQQVEEEMCQKEQENGSILTKLSRNRGEVDPLSGDDELVLKMSKIHISDDQTFAQTREFPNTTSLKEGNDSAVGESESPTLIGVKEFDEKVVPGVALEQHMKRVLEEVGEKLEAKLSQPARTPAQSRLSRKRSESHEANAPAVPGQPLPPPPQSSRFTNSKTSAAADEARRTPDENASQNTSGNVIALDNTGKKTDTEEHFDNRFKATISLANSIVDFYILPECNLEKLASVIEECQEPGPALSIVEIGTMCLATKDGIWMRARIEKISGDKTKAKIFFVDDGCRESKQISDLRVLSCHKETEDLVERVGLFGVEPLDDEKSKKDCSQIFKTFVEGDRTLIVTRTDINQLVKVESPNGRDVSESLLELEIVRPVLLGAGSCCDSVFRQNFVSSYLLEV